MAALPVIGLVAGLAGTAVSAVGAVEAGQANAANATYQAQVAQNNAIIAQQNAAQDIAAGEAQGASSEQQTRQAAGTIKAAQGANQIDVNTGSATEVQAGAAEVGQVNTGTIISNAAKTAYGAEAQATSETAESGLLTQEAGQATTAGDIGGLGSFLSGISSTGGNWAKFLPGTFGGPQTSPVYPSVGIGMA